MKKFICFFLVTLVTMVSFSNKPNYVTINLNNGDKYEGFITKGKFEGFGKYTYANGDIYVGDFKDGKQDGYGIAYFASTGNIYEGEFKNGKREGKGKFTYVNGDIYEGSFANNTKIKGTLVKNNNQKYIAQK